jgi:hypothetical protein
MAQAHERRMKAVFVMLPKEAREALAEAARREKRTASNLARVIIERALESGRVAA